MTKHRGLNLDKFVSAMPWELFQRYFRSLELEEPDLDWVFVNAEAMDEFLNRPENGDARAAVMEDFQRINDICKQSMSMLVREYNKLGLKLSPDPTREEMAMRLFLDNGHAFEFAWTCYLFSHAGAKASIFDVPIEELEFGSKKVRAFLGDMKKWFEKCAKGDVCEVRCFEDEGDILILVAHGKYKHNFALWEGDRIVFKSFRPASEDVLKYDPKKSRVNIRATLPKDRNKYLESFLTNFAKNPQPAAQPSKSEIFSLAPIQNGTFDFAGDGREIRGVDLLKVRLKLEGGSEPVIDVKSEDIMWSFERDLGGLSLSSSALTFARFRFRLQPEGRKPIAITFEIEPPAWTNLAEKRYADIIERFLEEQGVKIG
ncbi:MAG: hypothetical protein ABIH46_08450 [Chloroflexota bacterium]